MVCFCSFRYDPNVLRNRLWWLCAIIVFTVGFGLSSPAAEIEVAPVKGGQFVGVSGCKSSSCHGGAGEKRNQYLTWLQKDFHTRSYAILTDARSARIAETLRLPAAQESGRCTVCHSPFQSVASARLGPQAHPDEGVSCENCHGAAEAWLRGHTRKDWTYATRVAAGMRDLRNSYVRANTCVACHQNLESDILNAGHPELMFELDGQSVAEPEHWRDDNPASAVRAWLVGQAVALREVSWALSKDKHPGADAVARWNGLAWLLAKATGHQTRLPVIEAPNELTGDESFASWQMQGDSLARRASNAPLDDDFARGLLQTIAAADSDFAGWKGSSREIAFRRAERVVLALDRLSDAIAHQPTREVNNPALVRLFEDVRIRSDFEALRFARDLADFRATFGQPKP